jgi:hypothetical protein
MSYGFSASNTGNTTQIDDTLINYQVSSSGVMVIPIYNNPIAFTTPAGSLVYFGTDSIGVAIGGWRESMGSYDQWYIFSTDYDNPTNLYYVIGQPSNVISPDGSTYGLEVFNSAEIRTFSSRIPTITYIASATVESSIVVGSYSTMVYVDSSYFMVKGASSGQPYATGFIRPNPTTYSYTLVNVNTPSDPDWSAPHINNLINLVIKR